MSFLCKQWFEDIMFTIVFAKVIEDKEILLNLPFGSVRVAVASSLSKLLSIRRKYFNIPA